MAIYWYQCKKCGTAIKKDSGPNTNGCPKAPLHSWTKLGELGDTNYICKKCGITIQTRSGPNTNGCPNASLHSWTKL